MGKGRQWWQQTCLWSRGTLVGMAGRLSVFEGGGEDDATRPQVAQGVVDTGGCSSAIVPTWSWIAAARSGVMPDLFGLCL